MIQAVLAKLLVSKMRFKLFIYLLKFVLILIVNVYVHKSFNLNVCRVKIVVPRKNSMIFNSKITNNHPKQIMFIHNSIHKTNNIDLIEMFKYDILKFDT